MMVIEKSFLVRSKDIGALRYVSIEIIVEGVFVAEVKLEEIVVVVGVHGW